MHQHTEFQYLLATKHNLGKRSFEIRESSDGGRVVWSSEREIVSDEIVERVQNNDSTASCSIHQPTRGWYLVIKSSEKAFTSLQPYVNLVPGRSNPSEFSFTLRYRPASMAPVQDGSEASEAREASFILAPDHQATSAKSRISLRSLAETFASKRNSFTLTMQDRGRAVPILAYEDHPSLLHSDTHGRISLDHSIIGSLNVERTFFVTIALAYLGFLEDQEAYKAAADG